MCFFLTDCGIFAHQERRDDLIPLKVIQVTSRALEEHGHGRPKYAHWTARTVPPIIAFPVLRIVPTWLLDLSTWIQNPANEKSKAFSIRTPLSSFLGKHRAKLRLAQCGQIYRAETQPKPINSDEKRTPWPLPRVSIELITPRHSHFNAPSSPEHRTGGAKHSRREYHPS